MNELLTRVVVPHLMKSFTNFLFLLFATSLLAQNQNSNTELFANAVDSLGINLQDSTLLYVNDGSSNTLYYKAIVPNNIAATMVLFPPTGQTAEVVIAQNTNLLNETFKNDVLVIIPSLNYNLYMDGPSLRLLDRVFTHALSNYKLDANKIVFGGFSLGGMNAIRYTEMAHDPKITTTVTPVAVFGVDPPLDFEVLYYNFERTIAKNFSEVAMYEARIYLDKCDKEFMGSPKSAQSTYQKHSMYSRTLADGGNARHLKNVPVRIYSDPDISWHLENRRADFYDINALSQTAFINQLHILGNEKAEYVNRLGKGYRPDGRRHPHSWSLVEPVDAVKWILECVQ